MKKIMYAVCLLLVGLVMVNAETVFLKCEKYTIPKPTIVEHNKTVEKIVYVDKNGTGEPMPLTPTKPVTNSELFTGRIIWGEGESFAKDTAFIGKIRLDFYDKTVMYGYTDNTGNFKIRIPISKRFYLSAYDGKQWSKYTDTIVINKNHKTQTSSTGKAPWHDMKPVHVKQGTTISMHKQGGMPCVPFGEKHYFSSRHKVHGKWVNDNTKNVYWRKCRRTPSDWKS